SEIAGNFTSAGPNSIGNGAFLTGLGDYGGQTPTIALLPGSLAIGARTAAGAPPTDQRGLPRSGHVDLGAFQSQGFTATLVSNASPQSAVVGQPFGNSLAISVTAVNPVEPVDGGIFSFAVEPASGGASATLSTSSAGIAGGKASVIATANGFPG